MSEIKDLEQAFFILEHGWSEGLQKYLKAVDMIKEQCVHVVRCKDCIYAERARVNDKGFTICGASYMDITDNDFCSYGERKGGERKDIELPVKQMDCNGEVISDELKVDGCDEGCPYFNDKDCPNRIMLDAAAALEAAEKRIGDYIITGVDGEHYPCKPNIFEKTYEPADNGKATEVLTANAELIKNARLIAASINVHSSFQDWEAAEKGTLEKCADALEAAEKRIAELEKQLPKEGEWIDGDARKVTARCSVCGHLRLGNGAKFANMYVPFCEICGARMKTVTDCHTLEEVKR